MTDPILSKASLWKLAIALTCDRCGHAASVHEWANGEECTEPGCDCLRFERAPDGEAR